MESGNRRRRSLRRRLQTAHDIVRSGIRQEPAETADLAAQRPHRIADAAAKRKFRQRGGRRRTGETDDDGKVDAARVEFADPSEDRRAFETELRHDIDVDIGLSPPVPPCFEYLESVGRSPDRGGPRDDRQRSRDEMPCASINPLAQTSRLDLNGPFALATSPAIRRMRVTSASPRARARKSSSASREDISRAAICGTGL